MNGWLKTPLFTLSGSPVTLGEVLAIPAGIVAVLVLSDLISRLLARGILKRTRLDRGSRHAVVALLRYMLIGGGVLAVMEESGVKLTAFHYFAGALGVGIGLGLQFVVTDFFSGLLLLLERSVKVGDFIHVEGVEGDVVSVGYRTTVVMTMDRKAHVIPNNKLVSNSVVNWTSFDPKVRFSIEVTVPYSADVELVTRLLLEAAAEDPHVLKEPASEVLVSDFGSDGLNFILWVWNEADVRIPQRLESRLNRAILQRLKANGINIPNRQSDVYLRQPVGMAAGRPENSLQ